MFRLGQSETEMHRSNGAGKQLKGPRGSDARRSNEHDGSGCWRSVAFLSHDGVQPRRITAHHQLPATSYQQRGKGTKRRERPDGQDG